MLLDRKRGLQRLEEANLNPREGKSLFRFGEPVNLQVTLPQTGALLGTKTDTVKFNPEHRYVYVIPHSHTDLGWLKTISNYYHEEVFRILSSAAINLPHCPQ